MFHVEHSDPKLWFRENVSRETFEALEVYERELVKWQATINLVSKTTLPDVWARHFMDSYQLVQILESRNVSRETILADLGAGAGFPGMVLAIAGFQNVHLIESDQRKAAFLRNVLRETFSGLANSQKPIIHNERIENLALTADVITCRAFADVAKVLEISKHMRQDGTVYVLLKPLDIDKELTDAAKCCSFNHEILPSVTDSRGCILILSQVKQK